jgi:hypothetical protein
MAVTSGQMNFHNQLQRNRIASFALSVNKTVSKIGTGESKPIGKLEIPETMVKLF